MRFDLTALMREHKVSIRELANRMSVTMKHVREVRASGRAGYCSACDFHQAVTGVNIFNRARYDAMCAQVAASDAMCRQSIH